MSTLVETDERPGCLPGRQRQLHFPRIKTARCPSMVRKDANESARYPITNSNHSIVSYSNHINNFDNEEGSKNNKCDNIDQNFYTHSSLSDSCTLLKLPGIDRPRCSDLECQSRDVFVRGHVSPRDTNWGVQPNLKKCPSCLLSLDCSKNTYNKNDNSITEYGSRDNMAVCSNLSEDNSVVRFPNIFQYQNNCNFPCSFSTSNKKIQRKPETSSFSIQLKHQCNNFSENNVAVVKRKSKLIPQNDHPKEMQRSGQHSSPVLLPISTVVEYNNRYKGNKKKKHNRSQT